MKTKLNLTNGNNVCEKLTKSFHGEKKPIKEMMIIVMKGFYFPSFHNIFLFV